jgi:hypothetical protein
MSRVNFTEIINISDSDTDTTDSSNDLEAYSVIIQHTIIRRDSLSDSILVIESTDSDDSQEFNRFLGLPEPTNKPGTSSLEPPKAPATPILEENATIILTSSDEEPSTPLLSAQRKNIVTASALEVFKVCPSIVPRTDRRRQLSLLNLERISNLQQRNKGRRNMLAPKYRNLPR